MLGRAVGVAVVSVGLAIPSSAHGETTFSLEYTAIGACPDRAGFLDQVQQRTQQGKLVDPTEAAFRFTVRVEPSGEIHLAFLEIHGPDGDRTRRLSGESCVEVVSALALVVALAVDPHASTAPVPAPAILVPILVPLVPVTVPPAPWVRTPPRWSHDPLATPLLPLPVWVAREAPRAFFGFGAHFALDVGPAPHPLLGAAGFVQVRSLAKPRFAVRAELGYQASSALDTPGETLTLSLLRGRLEACAFGWMPARWLLLWPCVDVAGGGLFATRTRKNTTLTADGTSPWAGAGLGGRGELVAHESLSFELRGGVTGAFVRGTFRDGTDQVLFTPFPVGFSGGIGVATAF